MRTSLRSELTREQIVKALDQAAHRVPAAAEALGVSERTLYRRMRELQIRRALTYQPADAVAEEAEVA